ncbi:OprD family outer membrane porin [Pseudomonas cremoricolorata]|uniref:OprD family outer membrane porin n=1 Tax=Pseudomonas cremoricolorata TaxID=157783 RepID=UPI0012DFEEDD
MAWQVGHQADESHGCCSANISGGEATFKNLAVRWANATYRSNFGRGIDENRLVFSYTVPLM